MMTTQRCVAIVEQIIGCQIMADTFAADIAAIDAIDAVPSILDVVCRVTGMGFAAVARVTEDRWIACKVLDNIDFGLKQGGELAIETTIWTAPIGLDSLSSGFPHLLDVLVLKLFWAQISER